MVNNAAHQNPLDPKLFIQHNVLSIILFDQVIIVLDQDGPLSVKSLSRELVIHLIVKYVIMICIGTCIIVFIYRAIRIW